MLNEQIKNMKESEILNLYHCFNEKTCRSELDEIDKIINNNFKVFEKINYNVIEILEEIKRYKKNNDFVNIMNFYNNIVKGDYFSILLSKILLISFITYLLCLIYTARNAPKLYFLISLIVNYLSLILLIHTNLNRTILQ